MHACRLTRRFAALLVSTLLTACGSSNSGSASDPDSGGTATTDSGGQVEGGAGNDSGPGDASTHSGDAASDGPFETAAHGALPQVVNLGGPFLTAPKVQLIVYTEDPTAPDVGSMVTELTQTTTWSTQTSQYGVGPLTVLPTIQIAGTPPTSLNDDGSGVTPFEQTLVDNTSGASPVWGAADPTTIYMFVLPLGTDITSGGSCCTSFLGYHYEVAVGAVNVPYSVVCDCPPYSGDPLTSLQLVTTTVSHELVEAATDPYVITNPAFVQDDYNDFIWTFATGGELADMCEETIDSNYTPPGSTYMVQRTWSNKAAAAGTNPCVPVPATGPFFESMPVLPDSITIGSAATNGTLPSKGVLIPLGTSKTIDVQLWSDAPTTGPWKVTAYDLGYYLGNAANSTVSLDKTTGSNGDVLHLTITPTTANATWGGEGFVLQSDLNGQENIAIGAVAN